MVGGPGSTWGVHTQARTLLSIANPIDPFRRDLGGELGANRSIQRLTAFPSDLARSARLARGWRTKRQGAD
jgi:hypothetical protein